MTAAEARKTLNPKFQSRSEKLALIKNDLSQEVLCHEFIGSLNGHTYRIYVNAENGIEEKIDTIKKDDVTAAT
jgi:spore germination protein